MDSPLLFLFYALTAASLDDLGQGVQKAGIGWLKDGGPKSLWRGRNWPDFSRWVIGLSMCIASPVVLLLALREGPVNLTAALGVFGLVPLYLYVWLVLGERITKEHKLGLVLVLVSNVWVGWQSLRFELPESQFQPQTLGWILMLGLGGSLLWSALALWKNSAYLGFALGTLCGVLGGMNLLVLKWGALFEAWWTTGAAWLLVAMLNFAALQLAHMRSNVMQVLPTNSAVAFLFPMTASPFLFSEPFPGWLLLGLLLACAATALLTLGERKALSQSKI